MLHLERVRNKTVIAFVMLLALIALFNKWVRHGQRPKYIFINETTHHKHDLALKGSLVMAERQSGIENALILLKQLPNSQPIETVARDYFDRLEIGRNRSDRGILYLYSEKENRFKIEVSYNLEGLFPDVLVHRLEDAAQTYMLSEIPQDFLSELLITMNINGAEHRIQESDFSAPAWATARYLSGGAGSVAKIPTRSLEEIKSAIARIPASANEPFNPSNDVTITLNRYLDSLKFGLGEPNLPLLTEGSRIFRWNVPRNGNQQRRVYNFYADAMPYQLVTSEPFAVAVFRTGVANLPIVLRHGTDHLWYVDEPKAWTWFHRFEDNVDFFPKYNDIPINLSSLAKSHPHVLNPILINRAALPKPPSYPYSLIEMIKQLEKYIENNPKDPSFYAALADLYLFEVNWISKARELYEKAQKLAPNTIAYKWRLWELYVNSSQAEDALRELASLADHLPDDRATQRMNQFYHQAYNFDSSDF